MQYYIFSRIRFSTFISQNNFEDVVIKQLRMCRFLFLRIILRKQISVEIR